MKVFHFHCNFQPH